MEAIGLKRRPLKGLRSTGTKRLIWPFLRILVTALFFSMFSASFYKNRVVTPFVFKMFSASFYSDILSAAKNVGPGRFTAASPQSNSLLALLPSLAKCHSLRLAQRQAIVKRRNESRAAGKTYSRLI